MADLITPCRELLSQEWQTVAADPPWQPALGATWDSRMRDKSGPQRFYKTLTLDEIIFLKPNFAERSHLYLWCLTQHVDWGHKVAEAWGMRVVQMLTWCKPGPGTGRFCCNTEHVLLCSKGRLSFAPTTGQTGRTAKSTKGTWFNWPRGKHSQKPQQFYDLAAQMSSGPRLEMYARSAREGWVPWGDGL